MPPSQARSSSMLIKRSISRVTARPDLRHRPAESPVKALVEADTVCQPHHPVRMVPALSMGSALVLQSMCWKRMDYPTAGHHWELWAPTQTLLQANVITIKAKNFSPTFYCTTPTATRSYGFVSMATTTKISSTSSRTA